MLFLGMSMQASGQALEAERLLLAEYEACGDKTDAYALLVLRSLGFTHLNPGQLEQTRQIAQLMLQGATLSRVAIIKNWADWFLGVVSYQRNELDAAAQYFTQIVENRYTAQITTYRDAVAGIALIHQINGESSEALRMVESISQFDLEQRGNEDNRTRSLRARLQLLQGDLDSAGKWVDTFTDLPPDQPLLWLEEPQLTRTRILVARGAEADLRSALQVLDTLDEIAERTYNTRFKIEIMAWRSLALDAQGDDNEAGAVLKKAVELAKPGGFLRVFVDSGKPMQAMLRRLAHQGDLVEAILHILAAFPEADGDLVRSENLAKPAARPSSDGATLVEHLTRRELEVLAFLRGPLNTKEIAQKLYLSPATVKRHTINIYAKLGVNQRWSAVAKAEELNILPPG
jgi:LuxR family maltose regulon positive regulatory protein